MENIRKKLSYKKCQEVQKSLLKGRYALAPVRPEFAMTLKKILSEKSKVSDVIPKWTMPLGKLVFFLMYCHRKEENLVST